LEVFRISEVDGRVLPDLGENEEFFTVGGRAMRRKESVVAPQGGERREGRGGRGREPGAAQPDTFVRDQSTGRDFAAALTPPIKDR
jgi:hypothetical protein